MLCRGRERGATEGRGIMEDEKKTERDGTQGGRTRRRGEEEKGEENEGRLGKGEKGGGK
jgi:hypothetical protein